MIKYKKNIENNFIRNVKSYYNKEVNWFHTIIKNLLIDIFHICKKEKILNLKILHLFTSLDLLHCDYNKIILRISLIFEINWLLLVLLLYNQNIIPLL